MWQNNEDLYPCPDSSIRIVTVCSRMAEVYGVPGEWS